MHAITPEKEASPYAIYGTLTARIVNAGHKFYGSHISSSLAAFAWLLSI